MSSRNAFSVPICILSLPWSFQVPPLFWASLVSLEGLRHNSKLSCHRQLCYKRLAYSLQLQYFPCFCEKTPTLVESAAEIDSERAIKKMTLPQAMTDLSWCLCLHSVFEKSTFFFFFFIRNLILFYENIPLTTTSRTQRDFRYCRFAWLT